MTYNQLSSRKGDGLPVAIVKMEQQGGAMKILLAIDDSKFSEAAIRAVTAEYRPGKTVVRLLHVVEPLELPYYPELAAPYPTEFRDIERRRLESGRKLAEHAAAKLRAAGFKADAIVREGHARPVIVDTAAKWRANLVVMGSHGRTGINRFLLGSVSEYVVRHAPCSVQIVRTKGR
jgi:nucleotide-binding universal stress UspA family protein